MTEDENRKIYDTWSTDEGNSIDKSPIDHLVGGIIEDGQVDLDDLCDLLIPMLG